MALLSMMEWLVLSIVMKQKEFRPYTGFAVIFPNEETQAKSFLCEPCCLLTATGVLGLRLGPGWRSRSKCQVK